MLMNNSHFFYLFFFLLGSPPYKPIYCKSKYPSFLNFSAHVRVSRPHLIPSTKNGFNVIKNQNATRLTSIYALYQTYERKTLFIFSFSSTAVVFSRSQKPNKIKNLNLSLNLFHLITSSWMYSSIFFSLLLILFVQFHCLFLFPCFVCVYSFCFLSLFRSVCHLHTIFTEKT